MPLADVDNPFYSDFIGPVDSPVAPTHKVITKMREIRKASLAIDFNGKRRVTLNQRVRDHGSENFSQC